MDKGNPRPRACTRATGGVPTSPHECAGALPFGADRDSHQLLARATWRIARLPISILTARSQPRDEVEGIHGVALLEVLEAFLDRAVESGSLLVVEIAASARQDFIERHQLDHVALGAVGRLVEHRPM